jgi:serine/threonine protein kinase
MKRTRHFSIRSFFDLPMNCCIIAAICWQERAIMDERYRLIRQLPGGGFGNICVFFDNQLKREVVVKSLIEPSAENRHRFLRQAKILKTLSSHEHVVDILGENLQNNNPYIILEHCRHGTLQDWVTNRGLFGRPEIEVAYAIHMGTRSPGDPCLGRISSRHQTGEFFHWRQSEWSLNH